MLVGQHNIQPVHRNIYSGMAELMEKRCIPMLKGVKDALLNLPLEYQTVMLCTDNQMK